MHKLAAAIVVAGCIRAAEGGVGPADDLAGWGAATWGMTTQEVAGIQGVEGQCVDQGVALQGCRIIRFPGVVYDTSSELRMEARFHFDAEGRLEEVSFEQAWGDTRDGAGLVIASVELCHRLVQQYGPPDQVRLYGTPPPGGKPCSGYGTSMWRRARGTLEYGFTSLAFDEVWLYLRAPSK